MQNYYDILNIESGANQDQIRRSIHKRRKSFEEKRRSLASQDEIEKCDTELFFLQKMEMILLDSNNKRVYDQKLINEAEKRRLFSAEKKSIVDLERYNMPKSHLGTTRKANIFLLKKINGLVINQLSVSEYSTSVSKVYFLSLMNVMYRFGLTTISLFLVYEFHFWGALALLIWTFRGVRHTSLSKIFRRKKEEADVLLRKLLKDLKIVLGIKKAQKGKALKKNFVVRDQKDNMFTVKVRGPLIRGSLNVGDHVKIWCFGWGESAYFLRGKNLRNKMFLKFS